MRWPFLMDAVDHAHEHDDAEIGVVPAVDQQRLEGRRAVALGRRQPRDDRLQHVGDIEPGLGRDQDRVGSVEADHVLDLLLHLRGLGGRQVDLVEDGHDLVVVVERLIDIGQRLRLDALAGVDHQERALAGGEAAVDLIGEVDMAGGVDQVEDIVLAVLGPVVEPHRLRLDGDAALALDVHGIEHLLAAEHFALGEAAGDLNQPVGKGRLAVVDMGDNGEIPDVFDGHSGHGREITLASASSKGRWPDGARGAQPSRQRMRGQRRHCQGRHRTRNPERLRLPLPLAGMERPLPRPRPSAPEDGNSGLPDLRRSRPRHDDGTLNRSGSSPPWRRPAISPVPWRERRRIPPACRP